MNVYTQYQNCVNYLESLGHGKDPHPELKIKRTQYLLDTIGNPEKKLKIIHIAGTSGKGSTVNMIHSILSETQVKCGSYFSPHPTTTIERFRIGDKFIEPKFFLKTVEKIKKLLLQKKCPYGEIRYFELMLAVALKIFVEKKCSIAIIETGIGGKDDATNACPSFIQIITNIGYDHLKKLGPTLTEIARHKMGIIKKNSRVFTGEKRKKIQKSIYQMVKKSNGKLFITDQKVKIIKQQINGTYFQIQKEKETFFIPLPGEKQINNALLAIKVSQYLKIPLKKIKAGLKQCQLSCRAEKIQNNPTIILDGAHNKDKIANLVSFINKIKISRSKIHLILAIGLAQKYQHILKQIIPLSDCIYFTQVENVPRTCYSPKYLYQKSLKYLKKKNKTYLYSEHRKALEDVLKKSAKNDLIVITGSFFLAGNLRKHWYSEKWILKHQKSL